MSARIAAAPRAAFRHPTVRELVLVVAAYFAYFAVRGATEGDPGLALNHALLVQRFERGLGLFVEPSLQSLVLGRHWLVDAANWVYVFGHWPVIAAVGFWLRRSHPRQYRLVRNAMLISGAIGLVIFALFPVAPPRLADFGLVDTVAERSRMYRILQPPPLTNQYAAVPSLHVGWNLLIGIALFRCSTHRIGRIVGAVSPTVMLFAVLLTANHYVVDTVAGSAIALTGLAIAVLLERRAVARGHSVARERRVRSRLGRSGPTSSLSARLGSELHLQRPAHRVQLSVTRTPEVSTDGASNPPRGVGTAR